MKPPELVRPRDANGSTAWLVVFLAGASLRIFDLGSRPLSYDEGIHAFFSWQLAETGWYYHDPATHGPLLYYVNALLFWLLGDTDMTARLAPALAGSGLVLTPLLFRRWVGPRVALVLGGLLATSPLLVFFSRYLRNDIYFCLLFSLWIWACFRYWEDRKEASFYPIAIVSALAVVCKEIAFIGAAILALFFGVELVRRRDLRSPVANLLVLHLALFLPFGLTLMLHTAGFPDLYQRFRFLPEAAIMVPGGGAMGALLILLGWGRWGPGGSWRRLGNWLGPVVLAWTIEAIYFTTFLKNPAGLATGFFGSIAYWLDQQPVARGGQPWFYYGLVLIRYEFLPLALAVPAAVAGLLRIRTVDLQEAALEAPFRRFLVFWAGASLVAYTVAGERMPWLALHIALPLCWLAAEAAGRLIESARRPRFPLAAIPFILLAAFVAFLRTAEGAGGPMAQARAAAGWLGLTAALIATALILWYVKPHGRVFSAGWAVGLTGLLLVLSLWTTVRLNLIQPESPGEMVNYAAGDPEIGRLVDAIVRSQEDPQVKIVSSVAWPLRWYLRATPQVEQVVDLETALRSRPGMVVSSLPETNEVEGYTSEAYPYLVWPAEAYKGTTPGDWARALTGRRSLYRIWRVLGYGEYSGDTPQASHFRQQVWLAVRSNPGAVDAGLGDTR